MSDNDQPTGLPSKTFDPFDPHPPGWARMSAEDVARRVLDPQSGSLRIRRKPSASPVLRITDRFLTGVLDLRAVEFPFLLEFVRCRFENPPDLRQAKLAGCEFNRCWLPGLQAGNVSSDNDLLLVDGTVVDGTVDLTDGTVHGSLVLRGSRLNNPRGLAVHADRLQLSGALLGANLQVNGELRLPGLRTGGNVKLAGARLNNPHGFALNGNGMHVGGNLHLVTDSVSKERFEAVGCLFLPSVRVDSDLSLRGARLVPPVRDGAAFQPTEPFLDAKATLIADRIRVDGNLNLDLGLRSTGTLRIVNGHVGGSLHLTRATVDLSGGTESFEELSGTGNGAYRYRALHLDGTEILGGMDARHARIAGQTRFVDVSVRGSVLLDDAVFCNRDGDAIEGRRFTTGGNLDARGLLVCGSMLLPGAKIGANVDLRASRLIRPGGFLTEPGRKPSLDLRASSIGRDLICSRGTRDNRAFSATGEVRMRRAEVGRQTNFTGAELGGAVAPSHDVLNAYGLDTQELRLDLGTPPRGRVNLRHARCTSLTDNEKLWHAEGRIDLDDFRYDALATPIELKDDVEVARRLAWLRQAREEIYQPGPYDQLAAVLRASGNEEHASSVLIEKQKRRYEALAEGYRVLGPVVLVWSWLQRWTVGYGYRPMRALLWLLACLLIGTAWFATIPVPDETNADDRLAWNPLLYTLDLVVPIVDFGHKNRWQISGGSQWLSAALIAAGWILATTVAAGVTRMLRRST